jgi:hypothetical protein
LKKELEEVKQQLMAETLKTKMREQEFREEIDRLKGEILKKSTLLEKSESKKISMSFKINNF